MPTAITRGAASALAFGWARIAAVATDLYFKYVTMLLPGNGTNGAQNNTFLDSSTNNFTITRNGNTTQGTFSPYGSNWSNWLSSTAAYLRVATSASLASGTSSFTLEFWYLSGVNSNGRPLGNGNNDAWGANKWVFANQATGKLEFFVYNYNTATAMFSSTSTTVAYDGKWHHIAITRSGTTWAMFIDGTRQGTTVTSSASLNGTTSTINVGWSYLTGDTGAAFTGYISNCRFVNGTAVYDPTQSTITVPTAPLTAISGTAFLSCQSNRFVDNSTNAFAITPIGTASVQRFNPFSPAAAYSTAAIGGSGYFDGTGDYLSIPDNASLEGFTGDFTIESWCYFNNNSNQTLFNKGWDAASTFSPYLIYGNGTNLYFAATTTGTSWDVVNIPIVGTLLTGQWYHIAVTRSGTTYRTFANGVLVSTGTLSGTLWSNTADLRLGADSTGARNFNGYMTDARIVNGTAVYTAAFTPPTAPLTAITNTKLLCNMTNAGIIDNAMMADGETVGGVQISTAQSKFGGSSMLFNGTTGYLNFPASQNWIMRRDLTIECWAYRSAASNGTIFDQWFTSAATNWQMYVTAAGVLYWYYDSTSSINSGATTLATGQWYHIAFVRYNGTLTMYLNGTAVGSTVAFTGAMGQNATFWIGAQHSGGPTLFWNGYIDDARITNGYARYTSNFTPPTAAFPTQ